MCTQGDRPGLGGGESKVFPLPSGTNEHLDPGRKLIAFIKMNFSRRKEKKVTKSLFLI